MSNSIMRRNSSKQGLQNLTRVTAQRSMEDAEEIERERRRSARGKQHGQGSHSGPTSLPQDNGFLAEAAVSDSELKPSSQLVLEEDEGFSDWTHKLEKHKQRQLNEHEVQKDQRPKENRSSEPRQKSHSEEGEEWEQREHKSQDASRRYAAEKITDQKKGVKIYTSKVFMPQEMRYSHTNGEAAEKTSYLVAGILSPCRSASLPDQSEMDGEVAVAFLETEKSPEKVCSSHEEREETEKSPGKVFSSHEEREETEKSPGKVCSSHEEREETEGLVGLSNAQDQERQELEELNRRRDERRKDGEEEEVEHQREEEEQHRNVQEVEETQRMKEDGGETVKVEAAERRMKTLSISSNEGDESTGPFSPMSPTFKNETEERMTTESTCTINERTESLNRSVKKSNSIKKTLPPVAVSKIDDRLEQYTHAIKISSDEANAPKPALMDLPSPTEPLASKKNLFEAGDAWSQNSVKVTPSKDAEGLKVGVADLITQWVKGTPDDTDTCKSSPSKPAEIKPGDVLCKKNLWENLGEISSPGRGGKGSSSSKRYKFMVTGHGKYERVAVDDDGNECTNGSSAGPIHEDF